MPSRHRVVPIAVAMAALTACSLFADLGGFSGGGDEGDGGNGGDASGADGAVVDGPVADGAASDAAVDGPWCSSRVPAPRLCEDFDDGSLGDWDDVEEDTGGKIELDPLASSAPGSARITLAPNSADCSYVRLTKRFTEPLSKWRLEFDLRLGDGSAQPKYTGEHMATVWTRIGGAECGLLFSPAPSFPYVLEQVYPGDGGVANVHHGLTAGPKVGGRHRVAILAELNEPRMSVFLDGKAVAHEVALTAPCKGSGTVSVRVGYHYARKSADPLEIRIDNVTFDGE